MPKLKGTRMEKCIGCGLCELMAALVAQNSHGTQNPFLKIKRVGSGKPFFKAEIDYGQKTDYKEVKDICPEDCFDIVEE